MHFCSPCPASSQQISKCFLLRVCHISKWINTHWDSIGLDYLSVVISMLDCQGLSFHRPNQKYDINFFQRCSIQGNRRMQINQFCMLKPISLSCMPGEGKWFFSTLPYHLEVWKRDFVTVMKHRKRELVMNWLQFRLKGRFSFALLDWA